MFFFDSVGGGGGVLDLGCGGAEVSGEEWEEEEVKVLEEVASFEELIVWGHEAMPEDDDTFVKGMEEWVRFAEAVSLLFDCLVSNLSLMGCRCMGLATLKLWKGKL